MGSSSVSQNAKFLAQGGDRWKDEVFFYFLTISSPFFYLSIQNFPSPLQQEREMEKEQPARYPGAQTQGEQGLGVVLGWERVKTTDWQGRGRQQEDGGGGWPPTEAALLVGRPRG